MRCAELTQAIDHVTEELVMPALVRADSYAVGIFVNRRTDDVIDTPVVTGMRRRMMLIAASWPSNKEAAVTNRNGTLSVRPTTPGKSLAATLMTQESSE
jgi:hypothetical protein